MTLPEFVGFIIMVLVLVYSSIKRVMEEKRRQEHPEEYAEEKRKKEEAFKEFIKSMQIEVEEESLIKTPPPPPILKRAPPKRVARPKKAGHESFGFESNIEKRGDITQMDERHIHSSIEDLEGKSLVSSRLSAMQDTAHAGRLEGSSKAAKLLNKLPSQKDMVVLHEVFGPPNPCANASCQKLPSFKKRDRLP